MDKISFYLKRIESDLVEKDWCFQTMTLPYQEMLDLKNIVMETYGKDYWFTLYDSTEREDKELTMSFKLKKKEEEPWEYTI